MLSITSLDRVLRSKLEPRTSTAEMKLKAMAELAKAGVPVGVMVGPIIPGLNDNEVPQILKRASEAGAKWVAHTILRLPYAVAPIFQDRKEFSGKSESGDDAHSDDPRWKAERSELGNSDDWHRRVCRLYAPAHRIAFN
jgi:DNA repair photolyase